MQSFPSLTHQLNLHPSYHAHGVRHNSTPNQGQCITAIDPASLRTHSLDTDEAPDRKPNRYSMALFSLEAVVQINKCFPTPRSSRYAHAYLSLSTIHTPLKQISSLYITRGSVTRRKFYMMDWSWVVTRDTSTVTLEETRRVG